MINLTKFKDLNIFFIGIGGISMSALASFCTQFGANVSGSDANENEETKKLIALGLKIYVGHSHEHITKDINLVVYSEAISGENVELLKAKELDISTMSRAEFLGDLSELYLNTIVVSGTHGKTTTTALIGHTLINAGLHPTIHLGGESVSFGNCKVGNRDVFLTEGCEYKNSIRFLHPNTAIITAVELDHTDFYKDISEIESAFLNLANNTKQNVIVFENLEFSRKINAKVNVVNVGFGEGYDIRAENIKKLKNGCYSFDVFYVEYVGRFQTSVVGFHNLKNCLCAVAVALVENIDISTIYNSLRTFKGVKRRFEKVGEINNIPIICDYAHHPTEIQNSITTACDIYKKVAVVFQPHTFSRTIGLMDEFKTVFSKAKELAIFKTYPARETYIPGGGAKDLVKKVRHSSKVYLENRKALKSYLLSLDKIDCVLVLGAGDIYDITKRILKNLQDTKA